ncbi:MAG: hypothetical protein WCK98_05380 [bacterium]
MKTARKQKTLILRTHGTILKIATFAILLINLLQFNFKVQTLALSLEQVNLDFTSAASKLYLDGDKSIQTKQALIRKINTEKLADRDFEVTNISQLTNFDVLSLTNLLPSDLIDSDDKSMKTVNKKVLYFNIFMFKDNGLYTAKLDTENLNSNFSTQSSVINDEQKNLLNALYKGPKGNFTTQSTNRYPNYKLPWKGGEAWTTEMVFNNQPWAWHTDHVGPALDFLPQAGSSLQMFASSGGVVEWICTTDNARNQSGIHIRTIDSGVDYGESLRYYHIRKDMLAVGYQFVSQGQYLGQIKEGGNTGMAGCNLYSFNTHLHFGFPAQNFMMQGAIFDTALSQANCLLYSTQNMQNVAIKSNYQLMKNFADYDSGPCKSTPLIIFNPNNTQVNLQLKINGQISTDTISVPANQTIKVPLEGMFGNLEIYSENSKDVTITFLNTSNFGGNYKPRPIGKSSQTSDVQTQPIIKVTTSATNPELQNNPSQQPKPEIKLAQNPVSNIAQKNSPEIATMAFQNQKILQNKPRDNNQNTVLIFSAIVMANLTIAALYLKKKYRN